ncbi:RnaseH-domain-containing protein [Stereum hirsutum FP-91666 SS1]|uniref:ribonuclease H n=1 Tax=Stereum hirsutum (strain FP-91666) TaxID=721885 RepID=R7RXG1_STEHR|nr:RnaseH-domain-containing protein [Stereum hirsutum FP-91666 SS1]EIM79513.1 RnaseH-domain-containing protein [Stereum hirsutum FP-91666 SS1]
MPQTNQTGEVLAIWYVATTAPLSAPLHIKSDSLYAIDGLTKHLSAWEDKGWIGVSNSDLFRATAAALRRRGSTTTFQWVKGHSGIEGNEGADRLARAGAEADADPTLTIRIPPRFHLTGAKLTTATQAILTQEIKRRYQQPQRTATTVNLDIGRWAAHDHLRAGLPTDARIFKAIRSKNITKKERIFLYRSVHSGYKIGKYWDNIPGYEQRGRCPLCDGEEESMRHILEDCQAPEREQIWNLARELCEKKGLVLPRITIGTVLTSGLANFKTERGKRRPGANRFFQILVTSSAHLIWVLRCERRITREDGDNFSAQEIHDRWVTRMNTRLELDRVATSKRRFGAKALRPSIVLQTWGGTLLDEKNLPEDWLRQSGVLVGIPSWRPGRNR